MNEMPSERIVNFRNLYYEELKSNEKCIPFMYVPCSTPMENVIEKLHSKGKLESPKIILLMIEKSADNLSDHQVQLQTLIIKGLINALDTTEMWLCLSNLKSSFTKEFDISYKQELLRKKFLPNVMHSKSTVRFPKTALIGICNESYFPTSEKLKSEEYNICSIENGYSKPNLDYFIIVEGKNEHDIHVFTLNFTTHLREKLQMQRNLENIEEGSQIPLIIILFSGDVSQIDLVQEHLKKEFPLVVIDGSGGLANLLVFTYNLIIHCPDCTNIAEYSEKVVKLRLTEEITKYYPNLKASDVIKLCSQLMNSVRCARQPDREFITVLTLTDLKSKSPNLPTILLKALLKSQSEHKIKDISRRKNDLLLAIDWNAPEIAKKVVFNEDFANKFYIEREIFLDVLTRPHREKFIDLFLSNGFELHTFLDSNMLSYLFKISLSKEFFRTIVWENILGLGTGTSITWYFIDYHLIPLLEKLTSIPHFIDSYTLDRSAVRIYDNTTSEESERKALAILAIWAILSYEINIVKILWKHSEQPIHLALFCSAILNNLKKSVSDISMKENIEKEARNFNRMATNLISECYENIPSRALSLLHEKYDEWPFKPLLEIVVFAKNSSLIASPCCQKYLDTIFLGKLKIKDLPYGDMTIPVWLKVILSTSLIFPLNLWMRFYVIENSYNSLSKNSFSLKKSNDIKEIQSIQSGNEDSSVNMPSEKGSHNISFTCKLYHIYNAPISKFWINQIFYLIYLFFFSVAVLWPSCGNMYLDFAVCVWTGILIMDLIYRIIVTPKNYFHLLNLKYVEVFLLSIFLLCYIISRLYSYKIFISSYGSKVMLSIALLYSYYRFIFLVFPISSDLGPMLFRIQKMILEDFLSFMQIVAVIMFSNGVIIHAIIFPDYPITKELFRRVFYESFIAFFRTTTVSFGIPDPTCLRLKRSTNELSFYGLPNNICKVGHFYRPDCPNPGIWPYIFSLQYFFLLKIILLTLLLALFSNTQTRLDTEGTYIWKYQRLQVVLNFSSRPAIPTPFSFLSYCAMLLKYVYYSFCKCTRMKKQNKCLEKQDFVYWKNLASNYYETNGQNKEENDTAKYRMEKILELKKILNKQKGKMRNWQGHLMELQTRKKNIHKILQRNLQVPLIKRFQAKNVPLFFSRMSPYPLTNIYRLPVPDKYVPWSCSWKNYDPIAYTMPLEDFPPEIKLFVDVDIQRMREIEGENFTMPSFHWNISSTSPAGVIFNRKSWILNKLGNSLEYDIDAEGLPINPFGRTGLRGRGNLPRWGPNQCIFVIITRWQKLGHMYYHQYLEVVVLMDEEAISLPGGFITKENIYSTIESLFLNEKQWLSETDMVDFFLSMSSDSEKEFLHQCTDRSITEKSDALVTPSKFFREDSLKLEEKEDSDNKYFIKKKILKGYFDDVFNTDQAWYEGEVWHFHYNNVCHVEEYFKSNMSWVILNEEVLEKMSPGQAYLLYNIAKKMKAGLEVI